MSKLSATCSKDISNRIFLKGKVLTEGFDLDIVYQHLDGDCPIKKDTGRLFWMTSWRRTIFENEESDDKNQAHVFDSYHVIFDENFKDIRFDIGEDVIIEGEIYSMNVGHNYCPVCGCSDISLHFNQPLIIVRKIHNERDIYRVYDDSNTCDLSHDDRSYFYSFCSDWHNFIKFDSLDIGECLKKDDEGTELRNIDNKEYYSVFGKIMLDKAIVSRYDKNKEIVGRVAMMPAFAGFSCPDCGFGAFNKHRFCYDKAYIFVDKHII